MRAVAVAVVLALAGCVSTDNVRPVNEVEKKIVVVQSCIDEAQIDPVPDSAVPLPDSNADVDAFAAGMSADAIQYRTIAVKQQDMLRACAKVKPAQ